MTATTHDFYHWAVSEGEWLDRLRAAGYNMHLLTAARPEEDWSSLSVAVQTLAVATLPLKSWPERSVARHARDTLVRMVDAFSRWGCVGKQREVLSAAERTLVHFDRHYAYLLETFGHTGTQERNWRLAGRIAQLPETFWDEAAAPVARLIPGDDDIKSPGHALMTVAIAAAFETDEADVLTPLDLTTLAPWDQPIPHELGWLTARIWDAVTEVPEQTGWAIVIDSFVPSMHYKMWQPKQRFHHLLTAPSRTRHVLLPESTTGGITEICAVVPVDVAKAWRLYAPGAEITEITQKVSLIDNHVLALYHRLYKRERLSGDLLELALDVICCGPRCTS